MRRSLRSWLWRVPVEQEIDEEIAFHVEMRTRELIAQGVDPAAARTAAIGRFGDVARLRRTCADLGRKRDREMRLTQWLDELRDDVRFALRQLRGAPAFTTVAALTLALGIGANSAIFALVDATLLRPLPFPDADRLVMVWESSDAVPRGRVSPLNLLDWNQRGTSFEVLGGFSPNVGGMVLGGVGEVAETVSRQWVTAGFFDALGVRPVAGRVFHLSDDRDGANLVVLSESLWHSHFHGDQSLIGKAIRLDGEPYTVVGVMPKEFQPSGRTSTWALAPTTRRPEVRGMRGLLVVGRMKPGVTLGAATADMTAVAARLAQEYPDANAGRSVSIAPLHDALIGGDLRQTSLLFVAVVGFVLLICCANMASLLMTRATARARELSIRAALGAGRRRVIRMLMTESLVLAAIGCALGAGVAAAILSVAPSVLPEGLLPEAVRLSFDARVVVFCAATALLVGLLFGLAPAWQASGLSTSAALTSESRSVTDRSGAVRSVLVAAEVATAVVLLIGAGLLLRTLLAVEGVDPGYRAERVLTMVVDPLGSQYPTRESLLGFFDDVEREIRTVPGVRDVAWATTLPLGPSYAGQAPFSIVGNAPPPANRPYTADYQIVSHTYFRALDVPLVLGRGFAARDTPDSVPVCVVNEGFVRRHLQGRSPLGVRVAIGVPGREPRAVREIVGVARQVKARPDETEDLVQIYVPMPQEPIGDMFVVVRPEPGYVASMANPVRQAIARVDTAQLVSVRDVMTLDDVAWEATGRHRFRAALVMAFAGLALVLAMIGVFGIVAYSVQRRVRDFGVRRALGATTGDVLRLVAGNALRVFGAGAVVGLLLSALLGRLLATMLFGVQPLDPATFAGVGALVVLTAIVATAGPAWRASRIDPAAALRSE
jgi:putative ABC transport system permease protein